MPSHNLLVLSDVHLGSELVHHVRPGAPPRSRAGQRRDDELVALLGWYRERRRDGRPWRLVIAGDLIDFTGMSVPVVPGEIETHPTEEERRHGLGSAADHTLAKLRLVAEHHAEVFRALARFCAAGNSLVVVRGNHDVDFHWPPVQRAFRELLSAHAEGAGERVEFADWFYYEENVVFVEHGHQYDAYCSHDHVLRPVLPSDPRRSYRSFADVLLRYVVRPTRGLGEAGHDEASALDYLRFGLRLGARGVFDLGRRFALAVAALVALWREHAGAAAARLASEHERALARFAEARRLSPLALRALAALQRPPVARRLLPLLAGVMIDRVALAAIGLLALASSLVAAYAPRLGAGSLAALALLAPPAWLWRRARGPIDPSAALRERGLRVSAIFPAAFVVMGHTHLPEVCRGSPEGSTYINLGGWADEEPEGWAPPTKPPSRTHLVVQLVDGAPRAEFLRWSSPEGPTRFGPREA
ncbi:MAG TPA: metallophosphoesterase [Polyangiaceae bacterium]|nr:metallophosphoesterase [Polyangiaceae bacterium]